MSNTKVLLKEEYVPAGLFLRTSFERDRVELFVRFRDFTPEFLADFTVKINKVKKLESTIVMTDDQKKATVELYSAADDLNDEFNFLVYYFKKLGYDTAILSDVKKDLNSRNIEGAVAKIEDVIQLISAHEVALESKGMAAGFVGDLKTRRDFLEAKNVLQNKYKNDIAALYKDNKVEYDLLYDYIRDIADAGKRLYAGQKKAKEYTVSSLIKRMRVVKKDDGGGKDAPPTPSV